MTESNSNKTLGLWGCNENLNSTHIERKNDVSIFLFVTMILNASSEHYLNIGLIAFGIGGILMNLFNFAYMINCNSSRRFLTWHKIVIGCLLLGITYNCLGMVLLVYETETVLWLLNVNTWFVSLFGIHTVLEIVKIYNPIFEILSNRNVYIMKITITVLMFVFSGGFYLLKVARLVKSLLFFSATDPTFYGYWFRIGTGIWSIIQTVLYGSTLYMMSLGIYRWAKSKANNAEKSFIRGRFRTVIILLILFLINLAYFAFLVIYAGSVNTSDQGTQFLFAKFLVILFQGVTIENFISIKLYFTLVDIFAKKENTSITSKQAQRVSVASHRSKTVKEGQ